MKRTEDTSIGKRALHYTARNRREIRIPPKKKKKFRQILSLEMSTRELSFGKVAGKKRLQFIWHSISTS